MMYSKILVPVDGSAQSTLGLAEAIKVAKSFAVTLRLVHVVNEFIMADAAYVPWLYYERLIEPMREMGKKILKSAEATVRQQGLESQTALLDTIGGAVFEFFVSRLPNASNFLVAAGLEQVLDYLASLNFSKVEIEWLESTKRFSPTLCSG